MPHRRNPSAANLLASAMSLDRRGREKQAIPIYRQALRAGLKGRQLRDAMVCLGSSLRTVGQSGQAIRILRRAEKKFPNDKPIKLFLVLALHGAGENVNALKLLAGMILEKGDLSGFGNVLRRKFRAL